MALSIDHFHMKARMTSQNKYAAGSTAGKIITVSETVKQLIIFN
jgi:hypothetical protein